MSQHTAAITVVVAAGLTCYFVTNHPRPGREGGIDSQRVDLSTAAAAYLDRRLTKCQRHCIGHVNLNILATKYGKYRLFDIALYAFKKRNSDGGVFVNASCSKSNIFCLNCYKKLSNCRIVNYYGPKKTV